MEWTPERNAARHALDEFVTNAARTYSHSRNFDYGPDTRYNVSCLSPYLRHRLIEEPAVLAAVLGEHTLPAAEKFVQEVFWRGYFKGWLEHRPGVWEAYCDDLASLDQALGRDASLRRDLHRATAGETGIDCFDSWARELRETGYLHNHARMWFASIWIFTLQLPWQLGADFFYRELLDADPASNTLSWRWVGGLHTRGKHYLARADNIARFTDGRFHPRGQLNESADPLEEDMPLPAAEPPAPGDAPFTHGRFGLLLTAEDCSPESLPFPHAPAAVARLAVAPPADVERAGGEDGSAAADGPRVRAGVPARGARGAAFADDACRDAVARAEENFDEALVDGTAFQPTDEAHWAQAVVDWARMHRLEGIATAWAPTGPVATQLNALVPTLDAAGLQFRRLRRDYDTLTWPHATRGFFRVKKQIPAVLRELGLT